MHVVKQFIRNFIGDEMKLLCVSALILFLLQDCIAQKKPSKGVALETAAKSESILDSGDKARIKEFLKTKTKATSVAILHKGKLVFEYGDLSEVSYLASCRKSILAILYGKHVENGTIDLNEKIGDIGVDEDDGLLPIEKTATVDHIITARSGVFHIPANGGYDEKNVLKRGSVKPGEYFLYNNWDFNVGGYILEQKTGKSVYKEFEEQIAVPLGFQDWDINKQKRTKNRKKSRYSAYHFYLSTRDMAKIGQLMSDKGMWNGKEIVSKKWVEKISSTVTPVETVNARARQDKTAKYQLSYGYMWWIFENVNGNKNLEGAYTASGFGGQFITVIPKLDLVVAFKSKLPLLVSAGIMPGGTSNYTYWDFVDNLTKSRDEVSSHRTTLLVRQE